MTNNNKILLNCEIEETKSFRVDKNFMQTVIAVLSVVAAFVILFAVASFISSDKYSSKENLHQSANAVCEDVYENEVILF